MRVSKMHIGSKYSTVLDKDENFIGYKCVYCKKLFKTKDLLENHVQETHLWKRNAD